MMLRRFVALVSVFVFASVFVVAVDNALLFVLCVTLAVFVVLHEADQVPAS